MSNYSAYRFFKNKARLSFATLREANIKRRKTTKAFAKCESWRVSDWFSAMIGEAGEFANLNKKVDRGDFPLHEVRAELGKELADIVIYADILAYEIGVNLEHAVRDKFNEVSSRVDAKVFISDYVDVCIDSCMDDNDA